MRCSRAAGADDLHRDARLQLIRGRRNNGITAVASGFQHLVEGVVDEIGVVALAARQCVDVAAAVESIVADISRSMCPCRRDH